MPSNEQTIDSFRRKTEPIRDIDTLLELLDSLGEESERFKDSLSIKDASTGKRVGFLFHTSGTISVHPQCYGIPLGSSPVRDLPHESVCDLLEWVHAKPDVPTKLNTEALQNDK